MSALRNAGRTPRARRTRRGRGTWSSAGLPVAGTRFSGAGRTGTLNLGGGSPDLGAVTAAGERLAGGHATAYEEARRANEERYRHILGGEPEALGGHSQLYERVMGGVKALGEAERGDIVERGRAEEARTLQDMTSRGLTGTTIAQTMRQGIGRETGRELDRLSERLTRERLGYDVGLTGQRLGFMERREDAYPESPMQAAGLLGQLADNPELLRALLPLLEAGMGGGRAGAGRMTRR